MRAVETVLAQGEICVEFTHSHAATYAREGYDAKAAAADAALVTALRSQLEAKLGAASETSSAGSEVNARIAEVIALLERVWLRVELAAAELPDAKKKQLAPLLKLRAKSGNRGASKLVSYVKDVVVLLSKKSAAPTLEKLGRLEPAMTAQLAALGKTLDVETKSRGRKKGDRMAAVNATAQKQAAVDRFIQIFKRRSAVVFEDAPARLDELHQRLRAAEQPASRRKARNGKVGDGGQSAAGAPSAPPS